MKPRSNVRWRMGSMRPHVSGRRWFCRRHGGLDKGYKDERGHQHYEDV